MSKLLIFVLLFASCKAIILLETKSPPASRLTGSQFYKSITGLTRESREAIAVQEILSGNIPSFLKKMTQIRVAINDSSGKVINAHYFVTPDYLSIGLDDDFARIPLTPGSAQRIADSFKCFLPTRKIVDDIYKQARVKLEPLAMFALRDSTPTFYHHHLMIEGQRKGKRGLIAGIKKDIVISSKLKKDTRTKRVAIYGWHKLDGKPIQPLYTGHISWYVDYSHGVRLIYRTIWVNRKPMDYVDVMKDNTLRKLLCDEDECDVWEY
jgi:hypothetical protein